VFPEIGAEPIAQLAPSGTPKILALLDKILDGGHAVTAVNVRQSISGIFAYAAQTQRAVGDPTYPLRNYISKPDVKHKTPLTKDGIAELVKKIEASGFVVTRLALKLLLYLFVRPGEIRKAEWSEFDLERAVWTIPGQKMKKREKHLIPLPTQAVELLRTLKTVTGNSRWLFPNQRRPDDCMSENALNAALRRLAYNGDFSAHGFRATASTELHELGYRTDIIEFQLSHSDREETRASYNQAQYWGERQKMMQQWADMVDAWGRGDKNVHAIRAA
jgi:integrase